MSLGGRFWPPSSHRESSAFRPRTLRLQNLNSLLVSHISPLYIPHFRVTVSSTGFNRNAIAMNCSSCHGGAVSMSNVPGVTEFMQCNFTENIGTPGGAMYFFNLPQVLLYQVTIVWIACSQYEWTTAEPWEESNPKTSITEQGNGSLPLHHCPVVCFPFICNNPKVMSIDPYLPAHSFPHALPNLCRAPFF